MRKCSVDLITGFLSSGKTSFINHVLDDFSKDEVLVIQCERGHEDILNYTENINVKKFYSMDELKEEDLIRSIKFYAPYKVFIECNGVSEVKSFIDKITNSKLSEYLKLGAVVNLIDMTTFNMFLKNIPSLIIPNISLSNLIVLNKCDSISEKSLREYKDMIGKFNQDARIVSCIGKEGSSMKFNKAKIINRMIC